MSILFNMARTFCIRRNAPQLFALPQLRTRYSTNSIGWICPKYEDPPKRKSLKTEDPCDFDHFECEHEPKVECKKSKPEKAKTNNEDSTCNFKSMWENPCCKDPCPYLSPRFDDLYYKESDKRKRVYTRTWEECPTIKVLCKKVCCLDKIQPPEFETRCLKRCPNDSCPIGCTDGLRKLMCTFGNPLKCLRTFMPCCPKGSTRHPPSCKRERVRVKCKKRCTQYPCYSECSKKKLKPLRQVECRCLDVPPWCLALRAKRKMF